MRFPTLLAFFAVTACFATAQAAPAPTAHVADDIYIHAKIYTGIGFAQDKPQVVDAMAVADGKILAIGTTEQIRKLAGPHTRVHDVNTARTGTYIFPGFDDAHLHLGMAGQTKMHVDLTDAHSLKEMLYLVGIAAIGPQSHWITGGNWDQTLWRVPDLPTRQDLDRVTNGHPAYLERIDGHIAVVNTAALKAAGITGKTVPPQGGAIDLDANGEPTGILRETAKEIVTKIIPPPTHHERFMGDALAISDAVSHGVTSVQDFSDWDDFLVYDEMEKRGGLRLRITEWIPFIDPLNVIEEKRAHHDLNDPMLHTGMLKGFMDGSLGSRTAAMKEPYSDDPKNSGLPQYTQAELNRMTSERARAGFQIGFHAIGDRAAEMALEAFSQPGVSTKARNRIEHSQVVDPVDIPRYKKLGVIASMQPTHMIYDMGWAENRLGPKRAAYSYAWKAFLDAGVPLAFGTDYPVVPVSPFIGLYAAVTRSNEAGTKTYYPENKITRGQALYAYTQGSAYAEFAEKRKGKLVPGYYADFILVDRDLYTCPPRKLLSTTVRETVVGGKQSYLAAPQ